MATEKLDVDKMIAALLKVKKSKRGTLVNLKQVRANRNLVGMQPVLLHGRFVGARALGWFMGQLLTRDLKPTTGGYLFAA